ncbi:hypothetical protein [Acinetobacter puyangensis]|uniref:Uncharacterized protein n=1 Tax=Acinetobacter puyangensis TaxID=1096779 RepID=A0A240E745_9GAMM|nr:hypothetical protein [Acinetobacter puyangensis]SNX44564.1 hypothetical protein SAMN05421731_103302 [Acinetobacter puyangensis]
MSIYSKSQRGMATILMVALVGFALVSALLGTAYYLRMKQQAAVASHALTNAQQGAWAGVEIVRQYLQNRNATQLAAYKTASPAELTITLPTGSKNNITAKIIKAEPNSDSSSYEITAQIKNNNTAAKSASTIQVVYKVDVTNSGENGNDGNSSTKTQAINIYTNLNYSGTNTLTNNSGKAVVVSVAGNVELHEVTNISDLYATGTVKLANTTTQVNNIYANGTVTLEGGIAVNSVNTKAQINFKNAYANILKAGTDIQIDGSGWIYEYMYANNNINGTMNTVLHGVLSGISCTKYNSYRTTTCDDSRISENGILTITINNITHTHANGDLHDVKGDSETIQAKAGGTFYCSQGDISKNYRMIEAQNFGSNCESSNNAIAAGRTQISLRESPVIAESELGVPASHTLVAPKVNAWCYDLQERIKNTVECENNSVYKSDTTVTTNSQKTDNLKNDTANYVFYGATSDNNLNNIPLVRVYNLDNSTLTTNQNTLKDGNSYCVLTVNKNLTPQNTNDHWGYLYAYNGSTCATTASGNIASVYTENKDKMPTIRYSSGTWIMEQHDVSNNVVCSGTGLSGYPAASYPDCGKGQYNEDIVVINEADYEKIWKTKNSSFAPGIMLFEGNLNLGEGIFYNSILATGNIRGDGEVNGNSTLITAPNYAASSSRAGVAKVCNGTTGLTAYPNFPRPTNLCKSTTEMNALALGDIALLAGSYRGSYNKTTCSSSTTTNCYYGGDIYMKTQSQIFGNIVAGNLFTSSGTVKIYGLFSAMGLRASLTDQVKLTDLKITIPSDATNYDAGSPNNGSGGGSGGDPTVTASIKWARYL